MLKIITKYFLRTSFTVFQLCITFIFAQTINNIEGDSVSVEPNGNFVDTKLSKIKLTIIEKDGRSALAVLPSLAWNNYDKTQVGVVLYSNVFRKFDYVLAPMYGTASNTISGYSRFNYRFFGEKMTFLQTGMEVRRFSYLLFPENLQYNKLMPNFVLHFKERESGAQMLVGAKSHLIWLEYLLGEKQSDFYYVNEAFFEYNIGKERKNLDLLGSVKQGEFFANASVLANFEWSYKKPRKGLHLRFFAGSFLWDNKPSSNIDAPLPVFQLSGSTNQGGFHWLQKDYLFNEFYFDRNGIDPFFSNQVAIVDGGFKSITSLGNSRKWLTTVGVYSDIPIPIPVQPFVNAGMYSDPFNDFTLVAEAGLTFTFFKDFIQFHLPVVTTKNIRENQRILGIETFFERISFTVDMSKLKHLQSK
jgi:hypothetical protein